MSVNCMKCGTNRRTGIDLLCDDCRAASHRMALGQTTQFEFVKDEPPSFFIRFNPIGLVARVRQEIEDVKLPQKCSLNLCRERCDAAAVKAIEDYFASDLTKLKVEPACD